MIRKFALALAAVAAIGVAGLASATDASAKPVGWHGGGVHIGVGFGPHYGYGWRHRHWAPRVGFYAPVYGPATTAGACARSAAPGSSAATKRLAPPSRQLAPRPPSRQLGRLTPLPARRAAQPRSRAPETGVFVDSAIASCACAAPPAKHAHVCDR